MKQIAAQHGAMRSRLSGAPQAAALGELVLTAGLGYSAPSAMGAALVVVGIGIALLAVAGAIRRDCRAARYLPRFLPLTLVDPVPPLSSRGRRPQRAHIPVDETDVGGTTSTPGHAQAFSGSAAAPMFLGRQWPGVAVDASAWLADAVRRRTTAAALISRPSTVTGRMGWSNIGAAHNAVAAGVR